MLKTKEPDALPAAVADQIAALALTPGRPLLIVDADEVLFYFMRGLERFLESRKLYFDWQSYALHGNIRRRLDDSVVLAEELHLLLQRFFADATEDMEPVDGAAAALERQAGERALARHGMAYPLIANSGSKGPAVSALLRRVPGPAIFIDDIPHNHTSVARLAPEVHRLHFVADHRLAALLGPAPDCH